MSVLAPETTRETTPDLLAAHPDLRDLDLDLDAAGDLALELSEQRVGQEVAVVTGLPGISTLHCVTSRIAPYQLPRL